MAWLQENYVIAVVGLVVAIVLLWFLFGRKKAGDVAPTAAPPAEPRKPLEAAKPEIVAAEPARFKPKEAAPAPVAAPPPPSAPEPVAAAGADTGGTSRACCGTRRTRRAAARRRSGAPSRP